MPDYQLIPSHPGVIMSMSSMNIDYFDNYGPRPSLDELRDSLFDPSNHLFSVVYVLEVLRAQLLPASITVNREVIDCALSLSLTHSHIHSPPTPH